jgi:alpha-amylase
MINRTSVIWEIDTDCWALTGGGALGVLLQAFYFGPGRVHGVPSPLDGDKTVPFWWDHLGAQANMFGSAGFTALWIPPPLKGASGTFSNGYDQFDDYDLGDKDQKGTVPTRYGTREQLERCVALMRANGIDVYVDLVENQRDGDDGHFNFEYVDAFGQAGKGRFPKGPGDFHPHVPEDPGVFDDAFQFGRDLAPINGVGHHVFDGLLAAGDWLARALDLQGFRMDDAKGVSTEFLVALLNHGALARKFAVGEFFDDNIGLIQSWMNATQHRSAALDFPLRFMLANMCNNPGGFDMSSLDHAGLSGVDPLGSVTFVENHDTDQGSPIVRNKMLAYAYVLTAEGYPSVFYRDYSTDKNCFGLKPEIDPLIWVHEHLATGATVQRWKDGGVFAFERLGGGHLLVGLNKDSNERNIQVQTGFPPHTELMDFAGHGARVTTNAASVASITIPQNVNGRGYVCYARPAQVGPFSPKAIATTQDYEGAADLDIKPAVEGTQVTVCRVFADAQQEIQAELFFDAAHWTGNTSIHLQLEEPGGGVAAQRAYSATTPQGTAVSFRTKQKGFHAFQIQSANTPAENKAPSYKLLVTYRAPQSM